MDLLCISHLAQQNYEVLEVEGRGGVKGLFSHTKSPYFHIEESMQGFCVNKCQPLQFDLFHVVKLLCRI
jgi:hypothetical protein